ncbi:hypothetical protein ACHQM5_003959 [Ranunculus cassubicifolius]
MAAATRAARSVAMSTGERLFPCSSSLHRQSNLGRRKIKKTNTKLFFAKSSSDPNPPDKQSVTSAFTSPEDVSYMLKLGGGSVAGAIAIKYGSILFPELARPNLAQALIMICTPMLVSVFLLIRLSSAAVKHNQDNS